MIHGIMEFGGKGSAIIITKREGVTYSRSVQVQQQPTIKPFSPNQVRVG
jgi:hypothetical protein